VWRGARYFGLVYGIVKWVEVLTISTGMELLPIQSYLREREWKLCKTPHKPNAKGRIKRSEERKKPALRDSRPVELLDFSKTLSLGAK